MCCVFPFNSINSNFCTVCLYHNSLELSSYFVHSLPCLHLVPSIIIIFVSFVAFSLAFNFIFLFALLCPFIISNFVSYSALLLFIYSAVPRSVSIATFRCVRPLSICHILFFPGALITFYTITPRTAIASLSLPPSVPRLFHSVPTQDSPKKSTQFPLSPQSYDLG